MKRQNVASNERNLKNYVLNKDATRWLMLMCIVKNVPKYSNLNMQTIWSARVHCTNSKSVENLVASCLNLLLPKKMIIKKKLNLKYVIRFLNMNHLEHPILSSCNLKTKKIEVQRCSLVNWPIRHHLHLTLMHQTKPLHSGFLNLCSLTYWKAQKPLMILMMIICLKFLHHLPIQMMMIHHLMTLLLLLLLILDQISMLFVVFLPKKRAAKTILIRALMATLKWCLCLKPTLM
mmetsp:Transcript_11624/g.17444  ORF Transcript_11624/g.17444 Transcript_11624/m.17444 type:complete len:233 (-) Transcript_11624:1416-2114(-)